MKKVVYGCFAVLLTVAVCAAAGPVEEKKGEAAPGIDEEMMKKWQAYATPSEGHKRLEGMIGTWDAAVKMWQTPDAPVEESKGVSVNSWVLGGRYVKQVYNGEYAGMPFEGLGFTGFDNHTKKYIGLWMDNMSTGWMVSEGTCDPAGKVFTSTAEFNDFMTDRVTTYRDELTVVDENTHVMKMFATGPDGKEFLTMEITYTRKQ